MQIQISFIMYNSIYFYGHILYNAVLNTMQCIETSFTVSIPGVRRNLLWELYKIWEAQCFSSAGITLVSFKPAIQTITRLFPERESDSNLQQLLKPQFGHFLLCYLSLFFIFKNNQDYDDFIMIMISVGLSVLTVVLTRTFETKVACFKLCFYLRWFREKVLKRVLKKWGKKRIV